MPDITNVKKKQQQQQQKSRINGVFNTLCNNYSTSLIYRINKDLNDFSLTKAIAVELLNFCNKLG